MPTPFPDPLRRRVLQGLCAAGGVLLADGPLVGAFLVSRPAEGGGLRALAVVADLSRCTGCRTCEAVCAAWNHPVQIEGRRLPGLGNPALSRMRVHPFLPEVDVPVTCALCSDAPCVAACPVEPHARTGRRALYRHPRLHSIVHDAQRCLGCRSCAAACAAQRAGVIRPDPGTGHPTGICTLCDGEPQCALRCPYGALTLLRSPLEEGLAGKPPEVLARAMMERWYSLPGEEARP